MPEVLKVLKRQLLLRKRLVAAGRLHHDHVFVHDDGRPMRDLQVAAIRWRKTLLSLKVRYRRPYATRHSSVSWNLMLVKNPALGIEAAVAGSNRSRVSIRRCTARRSVRYL